MKQMLDRIQGSYWFGPIAAGIIAFLISRLMTQIDASLPNQMLDTLGILYRGSPESARMALLSLSGTILGTAGVVFSLLTVPLSVAASQFGSRLLRVYLLDRKTQIVLGMFVGTFVYCLSVALSIPPGESDLATPQISTTLGLLLSLATFGSIIALIYHIGVMLQAPNMVGAASADLRKVVRSYIPRSIYQQEVESVPLDKEMDEVSLVQKVEREGIPVLIDRLGYIQVIDPEVILHLSKIPGLVVHLIGKPGHFVSPGDMVARVWPPQIVNQQVIQRVQQAYQLGNNRSPEQDIIYGVNRLVEVALRAMSPAINDPYTAMNCLDHIGADIAFYSEHVRNRAYFFDAKNQVRVIVHPLTFGDLLDSTFSMLRSACRDNPQVLLSMLNTIETISQKTPLPGQRAELAHQVHLIEAESQASSAVAWDKELVSRRCASLLTSLETANNAPAVAHP